MRVNRNTLKCLAAWVVVWSPFLFAGTAHAAGGIESVQTFIETLIKYASYLAGSVAVFFIIVGGYRYVTSTNDPDKLQHAKGTLIHAGIGLAIIIGANVIIAIVTEAAKGAFGG